MSQNRIEFVETLLLTACEKVHLCTKGTSVVPHMNPASSAGPASPASSKFMYNMKL